MEQDKDTHVPSRPVGDDTDLLALRATDRYFDFLAAGQTPTGRDDVAPELTSLFTEWRASVGEAPIPLTPTLDSLLVLSGDVPAPQPAAHGETTADVIDITKHRRFSSWRREAVRAVSGAAAFLIVAAGGLTIAIQSAGLNDPLWSVNQALFTSNANDIELATYLNQDIDRARSLMDSGQSQEALQVLDRVQTRIDGISRPSRRVDVQKHLDATRKVVEEAPGSKQGETAKSSEAAKPSKKAGASTSAPSTTATTPSEDSDSEVDGTSAGKPTAQSGATPTAESVAKATGTSAAAPTSGSEARSMQSTMEPSTSDNAANTSHSGTSRSTDSIAPTQ